jgi:hypothetical protein
MIKNIKNCSIYQFYLFEGNCPQPSRTCLAEMLPVQSMLLLGAKINSFFIEAEKICICAKGF